MTKHKHNKKRNTAFLYETLIQELTKAILNKNEVLHSKILSIVKEHFSKKSSLYKELKLYQILNETKNLDELTAEKLILEVKKQHQLISQEEIFKEQTMLNRKIRKSLPSEVFSNFIPNYKNLATIYQIFSQNLSPKTRVLLENELVQKLVSEVNKPKEKMQNIDNIVLKSFIGKFNEKYNSLYEEQKNLLSKIITSFSDNGIDLKLFLDEEVNRLKGKLSLIVERDNEVKSDFSLKEKIVKVRSLLESFQMRAPTSEMFSKILKTQNLIRELETDEH